MKLYLILALLSVLSLVAAKPTELDSEFDIPSELKVPSDLEVPSELDAVSDAEGRGLGTRLLVSTLFSPTRNNPIFEWSGTVGVRISDIRITVTATNRPPSPGISPFRGGVGTNSVSLDFTSRQGITFRVEVFGR